MVTEYTHTSWFQRIASSLMGIVFGLVLLFLAVGLLWWNEGRAVKRAKGLTEGAATVVTISPGKIDASYDGKLVHLSGEAVPGDVVTDPLTGFTFEGLGLQRRVEMYQWQEKKETTTKKKLGGGEERITTYSYDRSWVGREVSSNSFKEAAAHANPPMPFKTESFYSKGAKLGAFEAGQRILSSLPKKDIYDLSQVTLETLAGKGAKVEQGLIYMGEDPVQPKIGDLRIRYSGSEPQAVSVVAKQNGSSLESYNTTNGSSIFLTEPGLVSAENMFTKAEQANAVLTWLLRGGGLFAIFIGFSLVLRPISVLADVVPFLGSVASAGISVISLLLSVCVGLVTIALAWVVFRPLIGIVLLILVGGSVYMLFTKLKSARNAELA